MVCFKGAEGLIRDGVKPPLFMFEAIRDYAKIYDWLSSRGYVVYSDKGPQIESGEQMATVNSFYFFAFHLDCHAEEIEV